MIEDDGIKDNIIRSIDRLSGVNLSPYLLYKTTDGIGSITAKFRDDKAFKELLDKLKESREVELIQQECSSRAPNIDEPFWGAHTLFCLFLTPEQKQILWDSLRKEDDLNVFDEFKDSPLLESILRQLEHTISKLELLSRLADLFSKFGGKLV